MPDQATPGVRENRWVLKVDHTTDPPTIVEEVAVLDGGRVVEVRPIGRPMTPAEVAAYRRASEDAPGGGGIEA